MNKNIMMVKEIYAAAWADLAKHLKFLFFGAIVYGFIIGQLAYSVTVDGVLQFPFFDLDDIVGLPVAQILRACIYAVATVLCLQGILDIIYKRSLRCAYFSLNTIYAIGINFSLVYFFPKFKIPFSFLENLFGKLIFFPTNRFLDILFFCILRIIFLCVFLIALALKFRCMFVDWFLLEYNYSIVQAFNKSWNLALSNFYIYLLCFVTEYIPIILLLITPCMSSKAFTIVTVSMYGLCIPFNILVRGHLFKNMVAIQDLQE